MHSICTRVANAECSEHYVAHACGMQVEPYTYGYIALAVNIGSELDLPIFLDIDDEIETALFIFCLRQRVVVHFCTPG